jgi:hypothetical protein
LKQFGGTEKAIKLLNYKWQRISSSPIMDQVLPTFGPDGPTLFRFIQSSKGLGQNTLDALMLVDLPLTFWDSTNGKNVPFDPTSALGKSSNGLPVLIRNKDFAANPDINSSKGNGWNIEIGAFPSGTQGFYVAGTKNSPVYYAFSDPGSGLVLSRWNGSSWVSLGIANLISSPVFGPGFVNPYADDVLYIATSVDIQVSNDGGGHFQTDQLLTALVKGPLNLGMSSLVHIAFNPNNPRERAAATSDGRVFVATTGANWRDLSNVIPTPRTSVAAVAIDCECVYVATEGRSIFRLNDYR